MRLKEQKEEERLKGTQRDPSARECQERRDLPRPNGAKKRLLSSELEAKGGEKGGRSWLGVRSSNR